MYVLEVLLEGIEILKMESVSYHKCSTRMSSDEKDERNIWLARVA